MRRIVPVLLVLAACSGSKDNSSPSSVSSSSTTTVKPAASAPSGASAAKTAATTSSPATTASASPAGAGSLGYYAKLEHDGEAKAKETDARCTKFGEALEKLTKASPKKELAQLADELAKAPPAGVSKEDATFCGNDLVESVTTSNYKALASSLNRNAVSAYERESADGPPHALCPSAKAIPASVNDVAKGPYKPKPSDFDDAGWKCLKVAGDLMTSGVIGQIEYKVSGKTWETIVRRPGPTAADKVTEYVSTGKIDDAGNAVVGPSVISR